MLVYFVPFETEKYVDGGQIVELPAEDLEEYTTAIKL